MKSTVRQLLARRAFIATGAAALGLPFIMNEELEAYPQNVNRSSKPSELKITDMRIAEVREGKSANTRTVVRLDTNQGISGYGEGYLGSSPTYLLILKSRLLGENPCSVDKIFRKIKQFGGPSRQGGGVSGVEAACWDLAGKAYGVPVYQMLGGKFRDTIRLYTEGDNSPDPKMYGASLKTRKEAGFTFLKMDLPMDYIGKQPGAYTAPAGGPFGSRDTVEHFFTGLELTDKGVGLMADYLGQVRDLVGMDIPLALDHFGHMGVNSSIKLGKALEKYNPAWLEDMAPWNRVDQWKIITESIDVPTATGEDVYLKEGFVKLCRAHAVDLIHPDPQVTGGILELKKMGDMAQEYGVGMVVHCAASPIGYMAGVHAVAATENFIALEWHTPEPEFAKNLIEGRLVVEKGFIPVPEGAGLGIKVNEEALKPYCTPGKYFTDPTTQWDAERAWDRIWS